MKKKKRSNKLVALLTTLILLVTMIPVVSFAGSSDIDGHWAETTIQEWLSNGMASGYPDNTFRPDDKISRAEFITLVNKVFYFTQEKPITFEDVYGSDWFYTSVKRAVAAGYIEGYPGNLMGPNQSLTRQEAAIIIAKVKGLELTNLYFNDFSDASSIASWSRIYVGAVVKVGLMKGYPDETFRAMDIIKRGEALVLLNNAVAASYTIYDVPGTYGPTSDVENVDKTVIVKTNDVILQNLHIKGDLIISEEVGSGNVILNNVTVDGETYIRGGGVNSIHINGGKYNKVTVQKTASGNVRIVATNIDDLEVVISESASGQAIILEGTFEKVQVNAPNVKISTQGDTAIGEMTVSITAIGASVDLGVNTVVTMMKIDTAINVTGEGTIIRAEVSLDNVTFETQPTEGVVRVTPGTPTTPVTPATPGGGSSGGSSGGDDDATVNVSGVSVLPTTMALIVGGSTGTITATVSPTNATNKSLTWSSSNLSVATVADGVVTPVAVGTTNVVATSVANTSMSAICVVTVTEDMVQATTPSAITLAKGTSNPVGGVTNVAIPMAGGTDTTGSITGWVATSASSIKVTVTDVSPAASSITINSSAYTSGTDYVIGTSGSALTVVVTTTETSKTTAVRTFVIPVTPAPQATSPSAITLAKGSLNPVGGVTNVAIPVAGGTDTTGAVTGWDATSASSIIITVSDAGSASSTIQINGYDYTSGTDYNIPSASPLSVVITTNEALMTTAVRFFTITVTP